MMQYSIIIPVLHEAPIINRCLYDLDTLEYRDACEVIVVDGGHGGDTIKVISRRDVRCLQSPRGRALQMNAGAAIARGHILIFLHADTQLPRNALVLIEQAMAGGRFAGGAFDFQIDSPRAVFKIISRISSLRSRLTRIPYGDQAIFMGRETFASMGRYPEMALMEDVALMQRVKKSGGRLCFISTPVITSARRWEKEGVCYTTLRNWLILTAYFLGIAPDKLSKYYQNGRLWKY
ncbi:MAG: hypothetical protein CSYNP_02160 [Syntrophus sp. SKADARSKE-3]|nr:hypothetical protein [Syntrophus sp. SKADARSKE-3]